MRDRDDAGEALGRECQGGDVTVPDPAMAMSIGRQREGRRASAALLWNGDLIRHVEHAIYLLLGVLLTLAVLLALAGSGKLLWDGVHDWTRTVAIFHIIDRLLFVLMLVEILHTVGASVRSGALVCEPFLIVGLIAYIRRILVITLETSQITQPDRWSVANGGLFRASMIELGVLAMLIVVLVGSIYVTRRSAERQHAIGMPTPAASS